MTAASYTTDLNDITTAETTTGWAELSGHTGGGSPTLENTYYIQNSNCVSQATGTKTGTSCGLQFDYGSDMSASMGTGDCFFVWHQYTANNAIDTWANGGIRFGVGSSAGNMNYWKSVGSDFGRNPYGGWPNVAIDPTFTADYTDGSPTSAYQFFGSWPNLVSSVNKGNPHGVDAIRYGRGELIIEHGDLANGYGTFAGIATQNDSQNNRWGLLQAEGSGYLWKGLMSFGNATNACDFRDANRNITVDDTPRTYAGFNKIEINNASSRVDWTAVNIQALNPSQLSVGALEMVDNADVNFTDCVFTDLGTFTFLSNAMIHNTTFRRCDQIDAGGGDLTHCTIDDTGVAANNSAVLWDVNTDPDTPLGNMIFNMGSTATHAIEFGTNVPATMTLRNCDFTGYGTGNNANDSTFHFKDTAGSITLNLIGCSGNFSYRTDGATITIVQNPVTFKVIIQDPDGDPITDETINVEILAAAGGALTVGTQIIRDTTDTNGEVIDTRTYSQDQPVSGWARGDLAEPNYRQTDISGTISKDNGLTLTYKMILE